MSKQSMVKKHLPPQLTMQGKNNCGQTMDTQKIQEANKDVLELGHQIANHKYQEDMYIVTGMIYMIKKNEN